jgi:four helix bundle protein
MQDNMRKPIYNYNDLEIYRDTYDAAIKVNKTILPKLPDCEKYDLVDQLRRSSKAIPRLIAEGYAKRHQKAGFQKYLDDAMAECNETSVGLKQCRDIYNIECEELITLYDKSARRIYRLGEVWTNFKRKQPQFPNPISGFKPVS